jgi:DMSO/TMAO reductase YedYZ molybdopterin-dependent catalytic subunit
MRALFRFSTLALLLLVPGLRAFAADAFLTITTPEKTLTLTATDFAQLPHQDYKTTDSHDKKERAYSGVKMSDLLTRAGAPLGEKMRGAGLTTGVIVRCKDTYAVLFALAEFDESFSSRTILLCDREDGELLPPSAAPLRLVTPGDKRGARSARQVTSIEIITLPAKP